MSKKNKESIPVQRLLIPDYIISLNRILKIISPFLASRFAARLFLSPFKYKLPEREKEMDARSRQTKIIVPSINREIVVYEYGESARKVLLVHGWSGSGTQLSKIANALLAHGYATISFDAPAHGKAEGKMSMMPYFIEATHHLDKLYGPFEAVIGHSLGGMASLRAVKDGLKTKKLVVIGTANSITHITREFARNMKMNEAVAKKMKAYLDTKLGQDMDTYSGAVSAEGITIPSLIIHDEDDVDVPVNCAYEINRVLENSSILITKNLGHRRILGDPGVINRITTFIAV
ncbi:alpha/beta hydrolase [Zunongwangia sp. F363]|uniref:Alpha/beta hydrolase n=1 Tax=Autumnicola tepida TaxID=3075595 RepID=A0ABU3CD80_9FLAO|nr:alpha/beta hydrolase [Zunongwangia sp. F363]MDT0644297.1 alpha/beta hydrolase [Zunongwangia sp. F363]